MTKQRGQTLVEFALTTPLMFLMVFGLIYGAVIFMDYLNFSNDARTVARKIAVTTDETKRKNLVESYNTADNSQFARFYKVTRNVYLVDGDGNRVTDSSGSLIKDKDGHVITNWDDSVDVMVTVSFERDNKDLPLILYKAGFPPERFAMKYTMKLEKSSTS